MVAHHRVDRIVAKRLEPGKRAGLVAHQPAITHDVCRQDGGEPSLNPPFAHRWMTPNVRVNSEYGQTCDDARVVQTRKISVGAWVAAEAPGREGPQYGR